MIQFLLEIVYKLFYFNMYYRHTYIYMCIHLWHITAKIEINMPQFLFSNIEWEHKHWERYEKYMTLGG